MHNETPHPSSRIKEFAPAPISFTVAAIPDEPIYSEIAKASLRISELCENRNIIDNDKWPCHLSLIISGNDFEGMQALTQLLEEKLMGHKVKATANSLYTGRGGFIGVPVGSVDVVDLHNKVAEIIAGLLRNKKVIRPHLQERWPHLSFREKEMALSYGSIKIGREFHPHLSVAQVGEAKAQSMLKVAKEFIKIPQEISFAELQVVDVGHKNEKWAVSSKISLSS